MEEKIPAEKPSLEFEELWRRFSICASPNNLLFALYFALGRKDYRLLDKLFDHVDQLLERYNMTPETIMGDIDASINQEYSITPTINDTPTKTELYGGLPLPNFHKDQIMISLVLSEYFIRRDNDHRLKEEVEQRIEEYIKTNDISMEDALDSLAYSSDNDLLYKLALEELNND